MLIIKCWRNWHSSRSYKTFFSLVTRNAAKLGHFIINDFLLYLTNTQTRQQKSENGEKKFYRIVYSSNFINILRAAFAQIFFRQKIKSQIVIREKLLIKCLQKWHLITRNMDALAAIPALVKSWILFTDAVTVQVRVTNFWTLSVTRFWHILANTVAKPSCCGIRKKLLTSAIAC